MSVPSHILKAFKKLGRLSTFVQFQTELLSCVEEDTGNSEEFLQSFHQLQTNIARVNFLYEKLHQYNLLEGKFTQDSKSDRKASKHKEKADKLFITGKYSKALQYYTRSIMKAQSQEALTTAYANRSAALFKLSLHEECLIDIDRALATNYPEHLKPNLLLRRTKVEGLPGPSRKFSFYEPPPLIPDDRKNSATEAAADCVEIKMESQSRRRVFATRNIQIGEVVAVETPFSFTVAASDLYHCHDCFELCYNPIPCDSCSQTLYCSEGCKDNASSTYHRYECPILISLKNMVGKHKAFLLSVKMSFLIDNESQATDIYQLIENMSTKNIRDELFTTALITALMFHLVKIYTKKFEVSNQEVEDKFKELLMQNLRICLIHAAGIDELCPNSIDDSGQLGQELLQFKSETVGCAIYPFYSLFRHVCCPNIFAHHHGLKRVLRAIRTIKKGEECLVSYGPYYVEHSKEERQNRLLSQYHFTCKCRACEQNWPQLDLQPYYLTSKEDFLYVSEIRDANVEVAKKGIPKYIEKVKSLEQLEPHSDLTLQQKLLSYCYDILGNKRRIL